MNNRPMRYIYLEAASAAKSLRIKANRVATAAEEPADKIKANDIAYAAQRFNVMAQHAADTLLTLVNDGTIRAYCEHFDEEFRNFMEQAQDWEQELMAISKKYA